MGAMLLLFTTHRKASRPWGAPASGLVLSGVAFRQRDGDIEHVVVAVLDQVDLDRKAHRQVRAKMLGANANKERRIGWRGVLQSQGHNNIAMVG